MARLPAELERRLHERHRAAQSRLVEATAVRLAVRLAALRDLGPEQAALYVGDAVPLVSAAQRRAAELAAGYVRTLSPSVARAQPPALEAVLADVLVTSETPWLTSPIIRARAELAHTELDDGPAQWQAALAVAAARARGYVSGDLAVAQRRGVRAGAESTGLDVRGYRKHPSSTACAWCRNVASTVYALPDNVPFHERDACSVAPVLD